MDASHTATGRPPAGELPADPAQVEDALRAFGAALRSYRLYEGNGPMLERFVEQLRQKLRSLWDRLPALALRIDERQILWEERVVYPTGDASSELAFLFYKDGIRELTLLPGLEGEELVGFLEVLARAPQLREDEDDLITTLWLRDFAHLRYQYVEVVTEGVELGGGGGEPPRQVSPESVRQAAREPSPAGLSPEDFQETLYFLDDAELRVLQEEVRRENERDLWAGVLTALFDRLEDGRPERQLRVVALLGELLPSLFAAGQLARAAGMLGDLVELAGRPGVLTPPVLREVRGLFGLLARESTISQLVQILEESPATLRDDSLAQLLGFFPEAIPPLMRAGETVTRPDVRRTLEQATQRLVAANREQVVTLLSDPDPAVAAAAARWVGRLGVGAAATPLAGLLKHPAAGVRLAAVEALQELRAAAAGKALEGMLDDPDREVRIAAAKALGALEFAPARVALESAITSKRLRTADRTEKIALFEAFGRLAGREGVALLDRTLNGKSWLGRAEAAEIRACAALGLARVRDPSARVALAAAANDADPVVRSAVARALKEERA